MCTNVQQTFILMWCIQHRCLFFSSPRIQIQMGIDSVYNLCCLLSPLSALSFNLQSSIFKCGLMMVVPYLIWKECTLYNVRCTLESNDIVKSQRPQNQPNHTSEEKRRKPHKTFNIQHHILSRTKHKNQNCNKRIVVLIPNVEYWVPNAFHMLVNVFLVSGLVKSTFKIEWLQK